MGSALDDPSLLDDQDQIGMAHRGKTVRDHQSRTARQCHVQGLLDSSFRAAVQMGGRFVQHQQSGLVQEQSRDRQTLFLPAGKTVTPIAHDSAQALR